MTLIIAAITGRGALLVADRRSVATSKNNGVPFVMSDTQDKIVLGPRCAVALQGSVSKDTHDSYPLVHTWLSKDFDRAADFSEQMQVLSSKLTASVPGVGLVAVTYSDGRATVVRIVGDKGPEIKQVAEYGHTKMTISGTGSSLVRQIIDLSDSPIAAYDLQRQLDYCAFLIRTTHSLLSFSADSVTGVGPNLSAAVVDAEGSKLALGKTYTIDEAGPEF